MGVLFDYFVAPDDSTAGAVIDWPGGPSSGLPKKGLFGKALPGLEAIQDTGVEPVVTLGMFEAMLTGRTFDEQLDDSQSRPIVAARDGGERLIVRIGDELVASLAAAPSDRLRELAQPWSQIEEFWGHGDPRYLQEFLRTLQDMAVRAKASNERLYCWVCV